MTGVELVVVAVAGAAGALLRHELTTGRTLRALHAVNVAGAAALGLVLGAAVDGTPLLVAVAGLGGLTSFSTWVAGVRARELEVAATTGRADPAGVAAGHLLVPAVLAVAAAALGALLGAAVAAGGTGS